MKASGVRLFRWTESGDVIVSSIWINIRLQIPRSSRFGKFDNAVFSMGVVNDPGKPGLPKHPSSERCFI